MSKLTQRLIDSHLTSIWTLPIVVLLLVGSSLAWFAYDEYHQTIEREFRTLEYSDRIAEAQVGSLLRNIEHLLSTIAEEQKSLTPAQRADFDALLAKRKAQFPEIRSLVVINAEGRVEFTATPKLKGFDSSQRDYFVAHIAKPLEPNFYVSRPFKTATGNDMSIAFSVAIYDDSNKFQGMAVSGIDPKYFESVLAQVKPALEGSIAALFNKHGDLIFRIPSPERNKDISVFGSSSVKEHIGSDNSLTRHIGISATDGMKRIYAISRVGNTGISVAVATPFDIVLSGWRWNLFLRAGIFIFTAAVTLLLTWIAQSREQERRKAESARKQSETELHIAAAAFESQEGMVVTDAACNILRVNRAFTEITGYPPEEIVGRNPRILKSSRHDADFYRAMWESIRNTGGWQGEIWDRRKNGEEYPKWLIISAVRNDEGVVTHYIGSHYDITERKKAEEKIAELAYFDTLTGLPNRFSLNERLAQALGTAERNGKQLAVMLIDLDHFKTINDTLGHLIGDQILVQVAHRLTEAVRQSDLVARLGGDEFIVVLPEIDTPADVAHVADKILTAVSAPYLIDEQELQSSPSIGICLFPDDATEKQDLIKKADVAMYHAKAKGRRNYQFFKEEIQMAAVQRLSIEADLRKALAGQQFVLHYQPQLDLRSGRLVGVEALVRWQHPVRGLVPPNDFIPIAEETGLIQALGDWVLEEACRQLHRWQTGDTAHIRISVNLSASQFLDKKLPHRIHELMGQYGLAPESLDLEVTESMTMSSPRDTIAAMNILKQRGLTLSVDDFGTGYSSLSYLKLFPISTLKIDRSFVKDIETDQNDADICDVTVLLAHKLGLDVVAEGVETQAQFKYLHSIGCEKIQGYLISKPLPIDEVETFIRNYRPMPELGTIDLWESS
ncbi:MAG: EAL domain-containing protein [Sterolibacterium sp.]